MNTGLDVLIFFLFQGVLLASLVCLGIYVHYVSSTVEKRIEHCEATLCELVKEQAVLLQKIFSVQHQMNSAQHTAHKKA